MLRLIYSLLLALVAPVFLYGLFKHKPGKPAVGSRWKEHFGYTPAIDSTVTASSTVIIDTATSHNTTANSSSSSSSSKNKPVVWFHAVSVGEVIAVTPLIKRYLTQHPDKQVLLTTTTPTGAEQAEKLAPEVIHRYMPLDFSFAVRGFLAAIKPVKFIIVETELWPNTLHEVAKANIPISVINARLSERSCLRYQKVLPIFRWLSSKLDRVLCQHADDASRFLRLGMNQEKVHVTGSIKFDISVETDVLFKGKSLREELGTNRAVWIAASTHQGEDEQVLSAHKKLLESHPNALLILVPRHPERFNQVADLCQAQGFSLVRRSEKNNALHSGSAVYLADTMGEMMMLLAASDVCFMGGSLVGKKVGGHNLLEPAAVGVPSITGPSYYNFSDITAQLVAQNGSAIVSNIEELATLLADWLKQPELLRNMGVNAQQVVDDNKGALARTLNAI
ncbi:lipid IV(A) 3-deoxy-D-manno-octulosonic acid transferase [Vibrio methylphosphonaticus]|uniref:lipid IV(A) 3-deoxy-D-manno-octulosonic acid transferase n=1 Tax=Vibrio methylphosphonaticus TaxID=2946866 RepID=UPI00202A8B3B|nr:lipid IV(A) 3-deoxy-D-manno-octulosonic acid transferase [Vibrio methylphosphonaticus]MCL9775443.1 lipid IV(A) 3-deoxy-D-manno-octulosonic acid transferase [Vibrio methylphosphonaticus]